MSAAATAAGYLYASGRLRGRNQRLTDSRSERAITTTAPIAQACPTGAFDQRQQTRRQMGRPQATAPQPDAKSSHEPRSPVSPRYTVRSAGSNAGAGGKYRP